MSAGMECAGACTHHTTHSVAMILGVSSRHTTSARGSAMCARVGEVEYGFECTAGREDRATGAAWRKEQKTVIQPASVRRNAASAASGRIMSRAGAASALKAARAPKQLSRRAE
eukprot:3647317-Pleurochrysis_carterae.AAC.4